MSRANNTKVAICQYTNSMKLLPGPIELPPGNGMTTFRLYTDRITEKCPPPLKKRNAVFFKNGIPWVVPMSGACLFALTLFSLLFHAGEVGNDSAVDLPARRSFVICLRLGFSVAFRGETGCFDPEFIDEIIPYTLGALV